MTSQPAPRDLVVLTADKNCQFAVRGILSRRPSLGLRSISADFYVHPGKDPGILRHAHEFLRSFSRTHGRAIVVFDREGCGQEDIRRQELEETVEEALRKTGWNDRGKAIAIDPELDVWVWSDSPHVERELHWEQRQPDLRSWLRKEGFLGGGAVKPTRPKEALEAALRAVRMPRSSALYEALAKKVSLQRCVDPAFRKLIETLQRWFSKD
jgi:hypothetical protein